MTYQKRYHITGTKFKGEIYKFRSLKTMIFRADNHAKVEKIIERAEAIFADYLSGVLVIGPLEQRAFAQYIETFGADRTEILLNKLQKNANFDVRLYLETLSSSRWQKIFNITKKRANYFNTRQLKAKIKQYAEINSELSGGWYHNESLYKKQIALEKEAINLATEIATEKMPVYVDDLAELNKYFQAFKGTMYNTSVIDNVLSKMQNNDVYIIKKTTKKHKIAHFIKNIISPDKFNVIKNRFLTAQKIRKALKNIGAFGVFTLALLSMKSSEAGSAQTGARVEKNIKIPNKNVQKAKTVQLRETSFMKEKEYTAEQKIWQNFYNTKSEIIGDLLSENAMNLVTAVKAKISEGIFRLPDNVLVEQVVYAHLLYKAYNLPSPIDEVLRSEQKLSTTQQYLVQQAIKKAGKNGIGVKNIAATHEVKYGRKLKNNSAFDRASKRQKQRYLTNLQQIRRLNAQSK